MKTGKDEQQTVSVTKSFSTNGVPGMLVESEIQWNTAALNYLTQWAKNTEAFIESLSVIS